MAHTAMPRIMRYLPLSLGVAALASAASTPVATNPLLTTITTTSTSLSVRTVGTSTSTTTPILCSDGSCIQISLVEVPILSTSTVLNVGTVVSTIGFTTLYSDVADTSSTTPPSNSAITTSDPATTTNPKSSTDVAVLTSSLSTSTITTGTASGQVSVATIIQTVTAAHPASKSTSTFSASNSTTKSGLETKYVAIIAVLSVLVGLAILSAFVFVYLKKKKQKRAEFEKIRDAASAGEGSAVGGAMGLHEADSKEARVELATTTGDGYRGTTRPSELSALPRPQRRYELPENRTPRYELG